MHVPVLRPLSLGEVLDTSFSIYRQQFAALLVISVLTQAIPLAIGIFVEANGGALQQPALWLLSMGLALVLGSVGTAASTFVVAEAYLGESISWQEGFLRSTPFMGRLIGTSLLVSLLVGVGLVLLIVPGVILLCGLVLTPPALVLENLEGGTVAMGRSWALSRGYRLKVLGVLLVAICLFIIPGIAFASSAAIATGATLSEEALAVAAMVTQSILQVLLYPYFYVATTVLYYDLRVRQEGYDLTMLASSLPRPE